jgi:hypothetical protein
MRMLDRLVSGAAACASAAISDGRDLFFSSVSNGALPVQDGLYGSLFKRKDVVA